MLPIIFMQPLSWLSLAFRRLSSSNAYLLAFDVQSDLIKNAHVNIRNPN
jgi:hypothetical protein